MKKIKQQKGTTQKGKILLDNKLELNFSHPVFCFKYLHKDYNLDKCTSNEKRCFIEQLILLSQHDWNTLQLSNKHGIGSEKIDINALSNGIHIPYNLTQEVKHLLAFRFDGKKAFIGYREKFVFHIFFIDRAFNVYKH